MKGMLSQGSSAGPSSGNNKAMASRLKQYEVMLKSAEQEKIKLKNEVTGLKTENQAL